MPTLASNVMDRSRAVLNDINTRLFDNDVLLPYLKIANDDLSDELVDISGTLQKEVTSDIALSANTTTLSLPDDMIVPIECFEKNIGQSDSYYKLITQKSFTPNDVAGQDLKYWDWREQSIRFIGATQNKLVRVRYYRLITAITVEGSVIELTHALNYLAYHTAALAAEHIAENTQKAATLEAVAIRKLNKLLNKEVKQNQSTPVRRKGFRLKRRRIS